MDAEGTLQRFAEHQRALRRVEGTIEWQVYVLRKFCAFVQSKGIESFRDVTDQDLLWYQHAVSRMRNKKGEAYCVTAQNLHLTAVRRLYRFLRMAGEVEHDPTVLLEYAKPPKKLPKDIISVSQMIKLIGQANTSTPLGVRDRAIMEVLYSTGIRRGELLRLDMNDIYFEERTMRVLGKGSKERMVPFGRTAHRWLKRYLKDVRPLLQKDASCEAVFMSKRGRRMSTQAVKHLVDRAADGLGLKGIVTPHIFRHCCATHMLDAGCDVRYLQELLGHEKLSTTARYLRVAINKLKQVHSRFHPREQKVA